MPTPKLYVDGASRQRAYRVRQSQARALERVSKGLPCAPSLATVAGERRWQGLLCHAQACLSTTHSEMQGYYESRSDAWQASSRGEALLDRMEAVESLLSDLESLLSG